MKHAALVCERPELRWRAMRRSLQSRLSAPRQFQSKCEGISSNNLVRGKTRGLYRAGEVQGAEYPGSLARSRRDWRLQDPPATRLVLIEHGERQRPGTPITIVNLMRSPNPMQAACVVSTPMPILIFVTAFFLGKRGLVPRGTFFDKKTTKKTFLTGFFYPAGSPYPTG